MDRKEAHRTAKELRDDLRAIVARDADQEVEGAAILTLDAVLSVARGLLPDHPVITTLPDVVSPEAIDAGERLAAKDALVIFTALEQALYEPEPSIPDPMVQRRQNRARFV